MAEPDSTPGCRRGSEANGVASGGPPKATPEAGHERQPKAATADALGIHGRRS
jgi:hypothetical protein